MKSLIRTLTLCAAALAALVAAPRSDAAVFRGPARTVRSFHGGAFRGPVFHGRAFARPSAYFYGRRYVAPFRVFAGSRFYSYCPGPGYIYVDDFGWVFPPFPGAVWIAPHLGRFGVRIGGFWR